MNQSAKTARTRSIHPIAIVLLAITAPAVSAVTLPTRNFPKTDALLGPFTMTAAAGMWDHGTQILTDKMYNVDAAGQGNLGLRVTFQGIDLTGLNLAWFPLDPSGNDWHLNRWEGGVQMGVTTADNLTPPPPEVNKGMGAHIYNSAGSLLYANPSANQGGDAWWYWNSSYPGSSWNPADRFGSGYDVRPDHGNVVNYAGKGQYVFEGAPYTDPLEGDLVFTGEYDGFASNHWYSKDAIVPHTEWVTGLPATEEQIHAANTFDMVIEYTPVLIDGRDDFKRYQVQWWCRKHESSGEWEGAWSSWTPDADDPDGGWIQPGNTSWMCGGYASDGTMTGVDEPGFDFSAVFPYASAFGWWRSDNPEQTIVIDQIIVDYIQATIRPIAGDFSGDLLTNVQDINPFVQAMTNPAQFAADHPEVDLLAVGDFNHDGLVNVQDINGFIQQLTGQGGAALTIPEPASILGLLTAVLLWRRR
ncbi:MAG: hypothetical protein IT442_07950 [Phycisphaeraceae bacterium]|nr:hypothetical protein [Phycisphaeraceae bacterium]